MRYQDFDILLFQHTSIPKKEFKPTFTYTLDPDTLSLSLPTLTSYTTFHPNSPFRISIHSWLPLNNPIETRIYIDGKLENWDVIEQDEQFPVTIDTTNDDNIFKFPEKYPSPNYSHLIYNPPSQIASIQILITEGYISTVDSKRVFTKTENLICFFYQYAEKHFLDFTGISYPVFQSKRHSVNWKERIEELVGTKGKENVFAGKGGELVYRPESRE
ncbi:hypothetical protein NEOLI_003514 [Neolecta irregularis DAH-3]|uniref:Uncharacterized protein n=1 Tax=Neolecta irregularis (strain DAH-3) TaxID=1198029 RepID=A0A1U7LUE5_NEOID|nr:hypothetical protein NEOLI_003514 [Neolecta irregularis DAH-3]|eukprot:OLL26287.1 hypothetical protein NEOLI_003514 [Neolecta irregularis DAH-3]